MHKTFYNCLQKFACPRMQFFNFFFNLKIRFFFCVMVLRFSSTEIWYWFQFFLSILTGKYGTFCPFFFLAEIVVKYNVIEFSSIVNLTSFSSFRFYFTSLFTKILIVTLFILSLAHTNHRILKFDFISLFNFKFNFFPFK